MSHKQKLGWMLSFAIVACGYSDDQELVERDLGDDPQVEPGDEEGQDEGPASFADPADPDPQFSLSGCQVEISDPETQHGKGYWGALSGECDTANGYKLVGGGCDTTDTEAAYVTLTANYAYGGEWLCWAQYNRTGNHDCNLVARSVCCK